ncbi:unnamed protein product [Cuscuta epithymum]|uniref:MULE transposase domain-containing protein n=1 Tax=Cuscuta epithymum TaxID=186058 RepID=A0AAV0GCV2_9ASTE|nr:unnamed protein product [Cuscuta epithymum]
MHWYPPLSGTHELLLSLLYHTTFHFNSPPPPNFLRPSGTTDCVEFQKVFWAFKTSIKGFKHCPPLLTIDGTHLYGKYKCTLMVAMGSDANNQLYPLAFAISEAENGESWPWFMTFIRHFITHTENCVLIEIDMLEL